MKAVPPTNSRLIVKRGGSSITGKVPKPVVLVDSREQLPFSFSRFGNWIKEERRATLKTGDYSVEGMQDVLTLERKSLQDLIGTLIHGRRRFIEECERMTQFRWRAILVEASYEDVKSPYDHLGFTAAHPNGIAGSLDAVECKFHIPVIYTSQHRALAEEKAASWLSKMFTYNWLESNGLGRVLQDDDI
jgi:ERCC4-type nuclease